MSARRWYAALAAGALALGLGACNGGGDDPPTTTTSSSSSSSTTSTATPSTTTTTSAGTATIDPAKLPPEAQKHTPEGAAAFVKYYFDQVNEAWTTPDATLLPKLADSGCKSCDGLQSTAQSLADKKRKYEANPVTVTKVTPFDGGPQGQQFVRVFITQHAVNIVDASGSVVDKDKAGKGARTASVVWRGKSWVLYGIA